MPRLSKISFILMASLFFSSVGLANIWTMECNGGHPKQPDIDITRTNSYFEIRINGDFSQLWKSLGYKPSSINSTLELKLPPTSNKCQFKARHVGVFECGNADFVRAQLCNQSWNCLGASEKVNFDPKLVNIYMSHSVETTLRHKFHHWDLEVMMTDHRSGGWLPTFKGRLTKSSASYQSGCTEKIIRPPGI